MTLVGWWTLTESSGDAIDYSGNNNDGTVNGATQAGDTAPMGYNCYVFDGTDDEITVSNDPVLFPSGEFSVSMWLYTDTIGSGFKSPISTWNGSDGWQLNIDESSADYYLYSDSSTLAETVSGAVNSGQWEHVVGIFRPNTTNSKIYINGSEASLNQTNTGSITDSGQNLEIGSRPSSSNYYDGRIFDVRIYDRALSPQEISYIYEVSEGASYVSSKKTL